jgi:hypothetical protein
MDGHAGGGSAGYGLYFLAGLVLLAAILMALFTRETTGRFMHRDPRSGVP